MEKSIKKMKFYVPMMLLTGTLTFLSPLGTMNVNAEEEEEVLYEEEVGEEKQEKIDEEKNVDNVPSGLPVEKEERKIEEATAENNENQAINADPNKYLDNENYYPETDPSENNGQYIPDSVKDEVDIKLSQPSETPKDETPSETPDNETPSETPENETTVSTPSATPTATPVVTTEIPKMGTDQSYFNKVTGSVTLGVLVLSALVALIKKLKNATKYSSLMAEIEEKKAEEIVKEEKSEKNLTKKR